MTPANNKKKSLLTTPTPKDSESSFFEFANGNVLFQKNLPLLQQQQQQKPNKIKIREGEASSNLPTSRRKDENTTKTHKQLTQKKKTKKPNKPKAEGRKKTLRRK